jgi:hypothetical protein
MPRMIPIRFGGSGPDRANGRNPATITAPAKITRPEWTGPAPIASRGSWVRPLALPPPSSPRCGHQGAGSPAAVSARHSHGLSPPSPTAAAGRDRSASHRRQGRAPCADLDRRAARRRHVDGSARAADVPASHQDFEATSPTPARCASTTPRSAPASARSPTLGLWQPCTHIEVAGVRLMNRDTLAHATRPHTDDHTVTSSNSDHPSNITNWVQCTRARVDDRRINGDRNCETASALSAFDKRKWASDAPAGTATTSTGSEIMIVGDLRTGYAIVDRISTTMEII